MTLPPEPRIPPLERRELGEDLNAILPKIMVAGTPTAGQSNIMRTLVRHPALFQRWTPFLDGLLNGELPERDRELLVLRTAWNCRSEYEWGQHVAVAKKVGLTDAEIERIPQGPEASGWAAGEATLLRAADELQPGQSRRRRDLVRTGEALRRARAHRGAHGSRSLQAGRDGGQLARGALDEGLSGFG
jgi:alkylhydroperoxidase family enzyme